MGFFMKNNSIDNKELSENQKTPVDYFNDITTIRNELKEIRESIDYMNTQIATYHDSVTSFRKFVDNEQAIQTHCLTDIQTKLQRVNSSVSGIPNLVEVTSEIDRIKGIEEIVGNIDYNLRNASSSVGGDDVYKNMLKEKITEYEEDLYKKLMRKYVIDNLISLYLQINDWLRISGTDESLKHVLDLILNKLETLGIKAYSSKPGDSFNPQYMTTGHYPNIDTNNGELDGKVAESVRPMFVWKLPIVPQQVEQMLLQEEEVTLYHKQ